MSNGSEACCILSICCPPAAARTKLVSEMALASGATSDHCEKIADFLLERFAMAPKSFQTVIDDLISLHIAHGHEPQA